MARRADKVAGDVQAERAFLQCGLPQHMGKVRGRTIVASSTRYLPFLASSTRCLPFLASSTRFLRNLVPCPPRFLLLVHFLLSLRGGSPDVWAEFWVEWLPDYFYPVMHPVFWSRARDIDFNSPVWETKFSVF